MALTANTDLKAAGGEILHAPLLVGVAPFQGSLMGRSGAFVRPLVAGDDFAGICRTQVRPAPAASGAVIVELISGYLTAEVPLAGVAAGDVGAPCFASDDGTFTLVAGGNSFVGIVLGVARANVAVMRLVTADIARPVALGLGTMSAQAADNVTITGGTIALAGDSAMTLTGKLKAAADVPIDADMDTFVKVRAYLASIIEAL
jgi:hypothetical protein